MVVSKYHQFSPIFQVLFGTLSHIPNFTPLYVAPSKDEKDFQLWKETE
jgi:hypothetical protein